MATKMLKTQRKSIFSKDMMTENLENTPSVKQGFPNLIRLSRLKGKTGIKNWNVLCRWALCYSLAENTIPTDVPVAADSNVEMSWYTFGGEYSDIYEALMIAWCKKMSLPIDEETLSKYFKLNIESKKASSY